MYQAQHGDRVLFASRKNAPAVKLDEPTLPVDQEHFVVVSPGGDFTGFTTLQACLETLEAYPGRSNNYFAIVQR